MSPVFYVFVCAPSIVTFTASFSSSESRPPETSGQRPIFRYLPSQSAARLLAARSQLPQRSHVEIVY
jgi:hypothetical protein